VVCFTFASNGRPIARRNIADCHTGSRLLFFSLSVLCSLSGFGEKWGTVLSWNQVRLDRRSERERVDLDRQFESKSVGPGRLRSNSVGHLLRLAHSGSCKILAQSN
jgi:hypothetical protein